MITEVKIVMDVRYKNKDQKHPICLRFTHQRLPVYITLNFSAKPENWDKETCKYVNSEMKKNGLTAINRAFETKKIEVETLIDKLSKTPEFASYTPTELRNKILAKSVKYTIRDFTEKIIAQLKLAKKYGNAGCYEQALKFLDRHTSNKVLTFDEINFQLLKKLEALHLSSDGHLNGLSFYLRTIRAIYNRAIKEGVAKRENYPFANYSIKETKTVKRAIRKSDIDLIKNKELEHDSLIWHARNYFMFSFYNIGMNFADMAFLRMKNIVDGRLVYTRAKTGKNYSIKLSIPALEILKFYIKGKNKEDFIFPIIIRKELPDQLKDLQNNRKNYNNYLTKLAKACEINANLTSYVARHSWATIAKDLNVPISVISEGLGHEDIKTTQIYLDSFDADIIDKANELIIG